MLNFVTNPRIPCHPFGPLLISESDRNLGLEVDLAFTQVKDKIRAVLEITQFKSLFAYPIFFPRRSRWTDGHLAKKIRNGGLVTISLRTSTSHGIIKKCSIRQLWLQFFIWATQHFQFYVQATIFQTVSDNKTLVSRLKRKQCIGTYLFWLTRWTEHLISFPFEVIHAHAWTLWHADYLFSHPWSVQSEPIKTAELWNDFLNVSFVSEIKLLPNK